MLLTKRNVMSKDEERTISAVSTLMLFKNGNNEVRKLWKDKGALPNNYNIALKGLEYTKKRSKLGENSCQIIEDFIKRGYLEYGYLDRKGITDKGWFLSYFLILCPNKSAAKVQIVCVCVCVCVCVYFLPS